MNLKYTINLLLFALIVYEGNSQTPGRISYQAVVRNSAGVLISNKTVKARISILKDSVNGTSVYSETHMPKTNANGLISLQIGGGTVVSGKFSNINWGSGAYFAKQEIDPDGGTNYTISAVNQMLSVPYALHAKNAEKCFQHYVGEFYKGGIVFHVWKDTLGVEHGLILNNKWLGLDSLGHQNIKWFNTDTVVGAFSPNDGMLNCKIIVEHPSHTNSIAKLCLELKENGFEDWYLPSYEEALILANNYLLVNNALIQRQSDPLYTNYQSTLLETSTELKPSCDHSIICYSHIRIKLPCYHKNNTIEYNDYNSIFFIPELDKSETHGIYGAFIRAIRQF